MDGNRFRILIVDDEPGIRAGLSRALACDAYELSTASDVPEALNVLRAQPPHLILQDLKMPGPLSGLDLIRHAKDEQPEILVIVITAHGSIETAVEAMRLGAQDYVTKPLIWPRCGSRFAMRSSTISFGSRTAAFATAWPPRSP
jgi:two-component system response regulator AtoC